MYGRYIVMRILLINTPARLNARPSCIPYGLATIAAVLRKAGFDVAIYDINALRSSQEEVVRTLKQLKWDVAGVSGLITTYKFQLWIIGVLKGLNPFAPIISGGGLATTNSRLLFDKSPVDITVLGEGERTMLELCGALQAGRDIGEVPGIGCRKEGKVVRSSPRENIADLDEIPFPAWDLLPIDIYLKNPVWGDAAANSSGFRNDIRVNRSMNVISSRGCPFGCRYCYHLFGRSSYRFRSARNVVDEIEALVDRYGVDFIGLVDDNLMAAEERLLEFCDLMERNKLPVTWGCHGRVTSAKPDLLNRMAETGCVWIGYGIESGSQKMLDLMNKKATVDQARQAIIDTRRAGIYANTTFIFGYPGETRETLQATVDFKKELNIECGSFFATPYPGTPLYRQIRSKIEDEEMFIESLGDATEFSINLTGFSDGELLCLKKAMDRNENISGVATAVDQLVHPT